jgi:hypothetical protein
MTDECEYLRQQAAAKATIPTPTGKAAIEDTAAESAHALPAIIGNGRDIVRLRPQST